MLTALALGVPVVLVVVFCALLKLALPAAPRHKAPAPTPSSRESLPRTDSEDRRAA